MATISHHSRKARCNFHGIYSLIRFLKTCTIKSVLDFWKRIMSGIVSQVQLKRKNTLWGSDQYPMLCSSDQYALMLSNIFDEKWRAGPMSNTQLVRAEHPRRAKIEGWPGPEFSFGWKRKILNLLLLVGSYTRIFNIAVRIPVPWHSRGYPIVPDFRNCLILVHMNNAALNFVFSVSANFRELFCAHLRRYLIWSFSLQLRWKLFCSIVDDNLMSLQMIMIAAECDEVRSVA